MSAGQEEEVFCLPAEAVARSLIGAARALNGRVTRENVHSAGAITQLDSFALKCRRWIGCCVGHLPLGQAWHSEHSISQNRSLCVVGGGLF